MKIAFMTFWIVSRSIEEICSTLENDGYKIHENMSPSYAGDLVMSRATANFEIIVTESEEEFWDTSDAWMMNVKIYT